MWRSCLSRLYYLQVPCPGVSWVVSRGSVECLVSHTAAVECMVSTGGNTHKRPVMPRVEGIEPVMPGVEGIEAVCTRRHPVS